MSEVLTPVHEKETTAWPLGRTPASYTLSNVRAVLRDRVTDSAAVVVTDGHIEAVIEGAPQSRGDVDGEELLLVPGLIDVHSDSLEKERVPRPSAPLPWDFALASFETKLAAAGVTTVFHGAGFHNKVSDGVTRRPPTALELCDAVDAHRSNRVDHRVLHRFNVRATEGAKLIRKRLEDRPAGATAILLSHEDHTPGQGQYADVAHFIDSLVAGGENREEVTARVQERISDAQRTTHVRDGNLAWAGQLAHAGRVRLVGHDLDTADAVDAFVERGGCVAEFPTTWEAAHRAREHGLVIVAGAPNVLRGGSHSGNVAAAELVSAGLVDALASDYLPSALLGSMTTLVRAGVTNLPQAVKLLTAGPAVAAGLRGRGTIVPGALADFALVDDRGTWPVVVTTFKALDPRGEDGL